MSFSLGRFLKSESGKADSKVPLIIMLLVVALLGYLGYKLIPVYRANADFEDELQNALNWDKIFDPKHPPTVESVYEKTKQLAVKYNIPLRDEDIKVEQLENGFLRLKLKYTKKVSFPIYGDYLWHFEIDRTQQT